jgi:hypothetical protein
MIHGRAAGENFSGGPHGHTMHTGEEGKRWSRMLLDLLTIFFIVAGCLLLWFNLRPAIRTAMKSRAAATAAAEQERKAKLAELGIIADKLEKHLISKNPSEVGLNFERDGARMKLKSRDYRRKSKLALMPT